MSQNESTNEISQNINDVDDELTSITDDLELELFILYQAQSQSNLSAIQPNKSKVDFFLETVHNELYTFRDSKRFSDDLNEVSVKYLEHL